MIERLLHRGGEVVMITIPRRVVLARIGGLPIAALLSGAGRSASADTAPEPVSLTTPSGRTVSGVVAVPATVPVPSVLLIHGASGLIDVTKSFASDFAREGFFAAALDLYDGETPN